VAEVAQGAVELGAAEAMQGVAENLAGAAA
jgi:hypothetical protein